MQEKETIYNGVTLSEFVQATRTVTSFVSGLTSAPINPHTQKDLVMTGLLVIPFLEAHNAFITKLKSFKDIWKHNSRMEAKQSQPIL